MPANVTEASAKAELLRVDRATVYRDLQGSGLMHERSRAGIDAARRRGVRCGRAPLLTPDQRADVKRLANEGIRVTELAQRFGVSRANIYNVLHQSPPTPLPSTRA